MEERIETARRSMEAYSRGDFDAALTDFAPDVVWEVGDGFGAESGTYHGHAGVRDFWRAWDDLFDEMRLEIEEFTALDDGRVLATVRAAGRGAGSGVPVTSPRFVEVFEYRGDEIARVRVHTSRQAAGLE